MSQIIHNRIVVALGSNTNGHWGSSRATTLRCINTLKSVGFSEICLSPVYETKAWGSVRQPDYLNLVAVGSCALLPRQLIDIFKQMERSSGRRLLGRNAERPLDIDLIDYRGRVIGSQTASRRAKLVLPHPLVSERPFVLAPLADCWPAWRHPISGLSAEQLLNRLGGRQRFFLQKSIRQVDSLPRSCD